MNEQKRNSHQINDDYLPPGDNFDYPLPPDSKAHIDSHPMIVMEPINPYLNAMDHNIENNSNRQIYNIPEQDYRQINAPVNLPINYETTEQKLMKLKYGIAVKQEYELLKSLQMCEDHYVWHVYQKDHNENIQGPVLFKFSLRSGFYEQCLLGGCRPIKMKAFN